MQLARNEDSSVWWEWAIADLSAKRRSHTERLSQLRAAKSDLALEAALGSPDAKKKLDKINTELSHLALQAEDWDSAIRQAEAQRHEAEQNEVNRVERERQEKITENMRQYYQEIIETDDAMRLLASRFRTVKLALDRAFSFMTPEEQARLQQLNSVWGPTLAAAHYGLNEFIELGERAIHIAHRQPLTRFVLGFVDRWIKTEENNGN